jgi:pyruvate dehydrogenase E2 component (dihydrolipoamide acetyltransferase)
VAAEITMPRLSDSMEEGTILKWLVAEGDEVKRGQPIAEIETDKANMTYEADSDGTISELVAAEGDTLAIGEVIARSQRRQTRRRRSPSRSPSSQSPRATAGSV